jgi:hypothetical protein
MVKTLLVIAALAGVAHADDDRAILGYRLGGGMLPIDHQSTAALSIGITAEHPIAHRLRIFGEYEWIWLYHRDSNDMSTDRGDGQRAQVGLRARLTDKQWHELDFFVDGDVGGGFLLASDNMTGLAALPDAFVGLHAGYEVRGLACEALVRFVRVPDGNGVMAGVGFSWR